ncbi:MAG: hypothetical protein NTY23_04175 [Chloroflexi bacterium]|nr:hypothetical protein [Chloroflexota bacterium]
METRPHFRPAIRLIDGSTPYIRLNAIKGARLAMFCKSHARPVAMPSDIYERWKLGGMFCVNRVMFGLMIDAYPAILDVLAGPRPLWPFA